MKNRQIIRELNLFEALVSTNQHVLENNMEHGVAIASKFQSGGRGRQKRKWTSEEGGLYLTVCLHLKSEELKTLTIKTGMTARKIIKSYLPDNDVEIKWPNDILVDGKKVCGILAESVVIHQKNREEPIFYIALGIGINLNQVSFEGDYNLEPTSIYLETGKSVEWNAFLSELLDGLDEMLQHLGEAISIEDLERFHYVKAGEFIRTSQGSGILIGFGKCGELILKVDGVVEKLISGEIV